MAEAKSRREGNVMKPRPRGKGDLPSLKTVGMRVPGARRCGCSSQRRYQS